MAFIESPRFFDSFALGSSFGSEFSTSIVRNISAKEYRKSRRDDDVRVFNLGLGIDSPEKMDEARAQHKACRGMLTGFRVKDHSDFSTATSMSIAITATDHILIPEVGDGVEDEFQLVKRYVVGNEELIWYIKKPAGTPLISLDDVPQGSGWSLDPTTGLITFTSPPGIGVVPKGGTLYDVPVRFDSDRFTTSLIDPKNQVATVGLIEDKNA